MYGLSLGWELCPDGIELIDLGPSKPGKTLLTGTLGGKRARYRTDRCVVGQYDISNLEDPLVLRFVNARSDETRLEFLSRFGLIFGGHENNWEEVVDQQRALTNLLMTIDGESLIQNVEDINSNFDRVAGFALKPRLDLAGAGGATRLALHPQSLLAFMLTETAMIVANGARTTNCQHCEKIFITGPSTGRRSHAMFCSDRCRVAAMRQRKAKAK